MIDKSINNKVMSWIPQEQIEYKSLEQIRNISQLPFIFHHIAVMPDCHFGKGATVGSCIPTEGAIIPAAVGVDIGCGMIAVKTTLNKSDMPEDLIHIRRTIEEQVPLSAGKYNNKIKKTTHSRIKILEQKAKQNGRLDFYDKISANWRNQLGSVGSGNHFIELVLDEDDNIWTFLHSGSRGIGNKIATHHIDIAKNLMKVWHISLVDSDLAYLVEHSEEFDNYITDLLWAQEFALLNREEMTERFLNILKHRFDNVEELDRIECHHNFTQYEIHFGKKILISRKGAIEAKSGQMGLIPGSMGTRSYVVRGKGYAPSFNTAPHGAGRRMSRGEAKRTFNMDDFDLCMEGIEVRRTESFLDELPGAYKDIDLVIEQSKDLVEVVHEFRQIINVKGA